MPTSYVCLLADVALKSYASFIRGGFSHPSPWMVLLDLNGAGCRCYKVSIFPVCSPKSGGRGRGCLNSRFQAAYFESDYCLDQGYLAPQYVECLLGAQYFGDVIVQGQLFRSARPCITLKEAQNTVAHTAMHQLLIAKVILDPESILPPDPPVYVYSRDLLRLNPTAPHPDIEPFTLPVRKENLPHSTMQEFTMALEEDLQSLIESRPILQDNNRPKSRKAQTKVPASLAPVQLDRVDKDSRWRGNRGSKGKGGRGGRKKKDNFPSKSLKQNAKQEPKSPVQQPKADALPCKPPSKTPNPPRPNSNLIPLRNNRLPQLVKEEQIIEDKLSLLKEIESGLRALHATASYWRLLERTC